MDFAAGMGRQPVSTGRRLNIIVRGMQIKLQWSATAHFPERLREMWWWHRWGKMQEPFTHSLLTGAENSTASLPKDWWFPLSLKVTCITTVMPVSTWSPGRLPRDTKTWLHGETWSECCLHGHASQLAAGSTPTPPVLQEVNGSALGQNSWWQQKNRLLTHHSWMDPERMPLNGKNQYQKIAVKCESWGDGTFHMPWRC